MNLDEAAKYMEQTKVEFKQWFGMSKYTQIGNPGQYLQPCQDAWIAHACLPRFQEKVFPWTCKTFGRQVAVNVPIRMSRFIEEAIELVQVGGLTRDQVVTVVDYVFNRPVGEMKQEVGGVMVTLAALCNAVDIDMDHEGNVELERVQSDEMIEKIRKKQASKPMTLESIERADAGIPMYVDPSKLMSKSERHVRRILARYAGAPGTYFDDGEASDGSENPVIDFLRYPPDQIEKCLAERNLKRNQPILDKAREKKESVDEQARKLMLMTMGLPPEVTEIYVGSMPMNRREVMKQIASIEELKRQENWEALNRGLMNVDLTKIDETCVVGLLRSSFSCRMKIANWHTFLKAAKDEFLGARKCEGKLFLGLNENEERVAP